VKPAALAAFALLALAQPARAEKVGLRVGSLALNQARLGVAPGIGIELQQERARFMANITRLEWISSGGAGGLFIGEELRIFVPIENVELGAGVAIGPMFIPGFAGTGIPLLLRLALGGGATFRFLDQFYAGLHYEFDLFPFFNVHTLTAQVGMAY
jgi:hypothetical protein